jgi:RNA polymerase sigma-70 factor (ECF subfamily)
VSDAPANPNGETREPSDDEIVAAIRAAETPAEIRSAWEPLLLRYQPMMHSLCRQMLGDSGQTDDACHDALVRVMRGFHTFDGNAKVSTWMYRVTMNSCLSRLRKDTRRKVKIVPESTLRGPKSGSEGAGSTLADLLPQSREPSVAGSVEQGDQRALVIEALGQLDPDLRSVLLLRDAQSLDYAQIAELLEVRVGTIKSRIFRARLALRQAVERVRAGRLGPNETAQNEDDE